ncbi:hypothetical protein ACLKA7_000045 [Drosophila subpalustris]
MGPSPILAAAGSSLQSLLCQDIHRSSLLRDQVYSPCSARTFINLCCCGIQTSALAFNALINNPCCSGSAIRKFLPQDLFCARTER